jgi:hypothetical protein
MQRFWLTVTKYGLQCKPEMTPLICSLCPRRTPFLKVQHLWDDAVDLTARLEKTDRRQLATSPVFMGRIGRVKGKPIASSPWIN